MVLARSSSSSHQNGHLWPFWGVEIPVEKFCHFQAIHIVNRPKNKQCKPEAKKHAKSTKSIEDGFEAKAKFHGLKPSSSMMDSALIWPSPSKVISFWGSWWLLWQAKMSFAHLDFWPKWWSSEEARSFWASYLMKIESHQRHHEGAFDGQSHF